MSILLTVIVMEAIVLSGLNPGIYAACVIDSNGCIVEQENIIIDSQPSQVVIDDLEVNDISCFGLMTVVQLLQHQVERDL